MRKADFTRGPRHPAPALCCQLLGEGGDEGLALLTALAFAVSLRHLSSALPFLPVGEELLGPDELELGKGTAAMLLLVTTRWGSRRRERSELQEATGVHGWRDTP